MPARMPLGAKIQQATIQAGQTASDLASETGVREDRIMKFFYGQRPLDTDELQKIMDLLGLEVSKPGASAPPAEEAAS